MGGDASQYADEIKQLNEQLPKRVKTTINAGDWVTPSRKYAKEHGESSLLGKYTILSKSVPASHLFTEGNSLSEFGYNPPKKSDISFMPSAGESQKVPTQEELDAMKERLPAYKSELEQHAEGRFTIHLYNEDNSKYVGIAEGQIRDNEPNKVYIYDSEVKPQFKKQGYGEALYRELAKYAQDNGATTLWGNPASEEAVAVRNKLFKTSTGIQNTAIGGYGYASSKVPRDISFMPSKLDEAHAKAIESGDTEEAQRLVDEAARKAGYKYTAYHGSTEKGVRVLSPKKAIEVEGAVFLSSNPEVAGQYRYERAYGDIIGEDAGDLVDARVKLENPYVYKPKGKIVDAIEFGKAIDYAKKNGNDGVIVNDIDDSVGMTGDMGTTYAVFNSEAIKSADPATYDDQGNLIPLSQRFDTSKQDIRFMPAGDTKSPKFKEWFGDSQVVDEEGKPRVMYHGTDREFNKFQQGTTFFAFDPEFADEFANRAASGWQTYSEEAYDPYKTKEDYESDLEKEPDQKQTPVIVPVYVRAENIFDANNPEHMKKIGLAEGMIQDFGQLEAYKPKIEKAGFDAYYDYEYGTEEDKTGIFTFSPEQVKSAIGNTGEYSKETADIRFMPYAPELPKDEDGKVDWAAFQTKTQETAKPLAGIAPLGGVSFMPEDKKDKVIELSTSLPKSEKTQIDPVAENRQVNIATASQDKEFLAKIADKISSYDFVSSKQKKLTPEKRVQAFKDFMVQNYLYLHDQMPEELRNRAKLWYDGARRISEAWGKRYNVRPEAIGGIIACLSPQRDWFQNVSMAERLLDIWKERDSLKWSKEMQDRSKTLFDVSKPVHKKLLDSISGKDFKDFSDPVEQAAWARLHDSAHNEKYYRIISPEGDFLDYQKSAKTGEKNAIQWCGFDTIAKVMRILQNPDDNAVLSKQLGAAHKVRSFYNNIVAPKSPRGEVTSDTHNVAAGLLLPLGGSADEVLANLGAAPNSDILGIYGTYPVYADAVRDAAKQRGVLPREMQSITWEAVRSLFENKSANQIAKTKAIWQDYAKGKITHEQAIKQIVEISGGFRLLDWGESNNRLAPEEGGASYAR
jgi:predicted GNAT family acetyltransferase